MVTEAWGRDHVANIITHGTFKPKSLTRRFFKITEPAPAGKTATAAEKANAAAQKKSHYLHMGEILDQVPPPIYNKEATLQQIIEGKFEEDEDGKQRQIWAPHPSLKTDTKHSEWLEFTSHLEGMIANFGIHAAGVVISHFPIYEQVPMWKNSKSERITQFDMKEVESLGLIKFDFLAINNLDILKECCRLVKQNYDKDYKPWEIPDGDKAAYALLHSGLLAGIFQMETSGSAKDLILRIKPVSIEELSDISALNRPGPLEANFHESYIANKIAGTAPEGMPAPIAEILKDTYWTLVYQEQVMKFVSELAGFTLREADDIRRAMGKKKMEVLEKAEAHFLSGCIERGMDKHIAETWWKNLLGFANYGLTQL